MFTKVIAAAALLSYCALGQPAKPQRGYSAPQNQYQQPDQQYYQPEPSYSKPKAVYQQEKEVFAPPKYDFYWSVNDDYSTNSFGHKESKDGYNTQGSYYVALPDGRMQKVTYYVDGDSGFVAEVSYEGEARYPEPEGKNRYGKHQQQEERQEDVLYKPQPSYQQPEPASYKSQYGF